MQYPIAKRRPYTVVHEHGNRQDPYFWMRLSDTQKESKIPDQQTQDVVKYLEEENEYTSEYLKDTKSLQEEIYEEIVGRIVPDDSSVPFLSNGYIYETKFEKGKEYPIYTRTAEGGSGSEIILDTNKRAEGHEYYQSTGLSVSPDNSCLAFAEDTISRRQYDIKFKTLEADTYKEDVIKNTTGSAIWAADNKSIFYVMRDEALRPFKILKHILGTDASEDVVIYHEEDEKYRVYVYKSKDKRYIIIGSASSLTTEYRYLDAYNITSELQLFQARTPGVEYHIAPFKNKWFVLSNKDKAVNFKLMTCSDEHTASTSWESFLDYDPNIFIEDFSLVNTHLILAIREDGNSKIRVYSFDTQKFYDVDFGQDAYMAFFGTNKEMDTKLFRLQFTSMITPMTTFDLNLDRGDLATLKVQKILGDFNQDDYRSKREIAVGHDGTSIPISIVYHKDHSELKQKPLLLYAYGSYGHSIDPYFSLARLSLLDRGFSFAIAHIRGGSDKGRPWYDNGKFLHKKNTFLDFISCGEHLLKEGLTKGDQLYAMGGSAGGLLMGAVMNMAPNLWAGVVAAVPFVDVLSTMIDDTIPLTVGEYEEWGNPNDLEYYQYIESYSPYDNIEEKDYPSLLITTGYHDSQVQYWEPAKWAAKLRFMKTDDNVLLLQTNMGAGHGGASGRYKRYKETALEYAFLLKCSNEV